MNTNTAGTGTGSIRLIILVLTILSISSSCCNEKIVRSRIDFTEGWKFYSGDIEQAISTDFDDSGWRSLNLPHDWSVEGEFSKENPTRTNGGALPAGIGWYRKSFNLDRSWKGKQVSIQFDGIYSNSEVWINSHYLGKRPNGYISFQYDLSPFLNFGDMPNMLAVRVDNSAQPNSRWYTGSGIYRNVWLVATSEMHIGRWGVFSTTPRITEKSADIFLEINVLNNTHQDQELSIVSEIFDQNNNLATSVKTDKLLKDSVAVINQQVSVESPQLWSVENPVLYNCVTKIYIDGKLYDRCKTTFGIRVFEFNSDEGFLLNGKHLKILGVNNHHDLGALGAAFNIRAAERQLEMLKEMGCNALRTSHNPPAPELLDLCDRMGFLVMDEAFDCWAGGKMDFDYHIYWKEWHRRDLSDMILRDRNHPSVIAWSIGNEIREQFDTSGIRKTKELVAIIKDLDQTRPVTCGLTEQDPSKNFIYQSGALDLISFNYKHLQYPDFPKNFPGGKLLASENVSSFSTRGHYNMPSDSILIWPQAYNLPLKANADFTASSYDNCHAFWGSTHEETWKVIKENDFISGMFVWSGFDFLGEPEPYPWPARSSYYGIIDLAGFPKDIYYFYQSEWTGKPVLHLFPHWNWTEGQLIDVWAYYNEADEVELYLNGESQGIRSKKDDQFHVLWRLKFHPGTIKAISRKNGVTVLEKEINTAGLPAKIELNADRINLNADGRDLSFITVKITDEAGNMIPDADNMITFRVGGNGFIAGIDNGSQTSMEPFKSDHREAFNGMCLLIVQAKKGSGNISVEASSDGLTRAELLLRTNRPINLK